MIATPRTRISMLWLIIGLIVGLGIFAGVSWVLAMSSQSQPLATYPAREASEPELTRVVTLDGRQDELSKVTGTTVQGPDGRIVSWSYEGNSGVCSIGMRDENHDWTACYIQGTSYVLSLAVADFAIDNDLVKSAKELGATDLLLVLNDKRLEVWPIGSGLPMP